jgi:hypothetical protein
MRFSTALISFILFISCFSNFCQSHFSVVASHKPLSQSQDNWKRISFPLHTTDYNVSKLSYIELTPFYNIEAAILVRVDT